MALALDTAEDYVDDARTLLQDKIAPYRYSDDELIVALNLTLLDTRRLRPDLFINDGTTTYLTDVPQFTAPNTDTVPIEGPFRLPIVFGMCAHALARDQEDTQDARAESFMKIFLGKLLSGLA